MIFSSSVIALLMLAIPCVGRLSSSRGGSARFWATRPYWVLAGIALLLVSLTLRGVATDAWPLASVQGGLQSVAVLVGVGWVILRRSDRMEAAGIILLAIAALLVSASLVEHEHVGNPGSLSLYVASHLGLIFVGLGSFALSFALSGLFLFQRRQLKAKNLADIHELPSLDTLDRLNARTQGIGFVALTVGIAMGLFEAIATESDRGMSGPTFWGTVLVWIWYAVGLQARLLSGWRGRNAAIFGLVGFGAFGIIIGLALLMNGGWHGV